MPSLPAVYGCHYYYSQYDTIRLGAAYGCDCTTTDPNSTDPSDTCPATCFGDPATGTSAAKYQTDSFGWAACLAEHLV
jgi:hypothetical protein